MPGVQGSPPNKPTRRLEAAQSKPRRSPVSQMCIA